ncbi:MAG: hypothetical protein ISS35_05350 [Kiritimatiellae bacterium]|nr:hypothetical protein [Kiritimatiellia bacterium]
MNLYLPVKVMVAPFIPLPHNFSMHFKTDKVFKKALFHDCKTIHASMMAIVLAMATTATAQTIPPPDDTIAITSAPPYEATGLLYISKADTNSIGLHCPVLIIEGFEHNLMNWPELYALINEQGLMNEMHAYGRDIVILNFGDSTTNVLANSALTESAINYINAHRADSTDKFVAIGVSLGGLTLRKALVDMPDHDVNTWVSFDAPHEGANIPLGLQEFFEFFGASDNELFAEIKAFLTLLDTPASREMLITHHSHAPDAPAGGSLPERDTFVDAMNHGGYPTNCKSVAISNGSGYGEKLPFDPGELIIHWHHAEGLLGVNIDADIHALPQSDSTASQVFYGRLYISILGSSKTVNSYYSFSLDNAPGGYRPSFMDLYDNIPADYLVGGDDYCNQTNHCFIPTVSALGIPIENIASNLASNTELLSLSPFDEIHYAITNEAHVSINPRNKRWFVRAILEEHDTDGDGFDDYHEFLTGTSYDSAESKLAVNVYLEVQLADGNAILSWDLSPNTQYEVWMSANVVGPWTLQETLPPSTDPDVTREYMLDSEADTAFFKIVAKPIDPVTD